MINEAALNYNIDLPDLGLAEGAKSKSEGIGILVDMAKAGKIDPWNIVLLMLQTNTLHIYAEMKSQKH